jgi:hypothetical protein
VLVERTLFKVIFDECGCENAFCLFLPTCLCSAKKKNGGKRNARRVSITQNESKFDLTEEYVTTDLQDLHETSDVQLCVQSQVVYVSNEGCNFFLKVMVALFKRVERLKASVRSIVL